MKFDLTCKRREDLTEKEESKMYVFLLPSVNILLAELSFEEVMFVVASLRADLGKRNILVQYCLCLQCL